MLTRIRQRRAVKAALRAAATTVASDLRQVKHQVESDIADTRLLIHAQLSRPPDCPKCGTPMAVERIKKGPQSGLQVWVCRKYRRGYPCSEYPLTQFPYASEVALKG